MAAVTIMGEKVYVTPAQKAAAQALIERAQAQGKSVSAGVEKIANATTDESKPGCVAVRGVAGAAGLASSPLPPARRNPAPEDPAPRPDRRRPTMTNNGQPTTTLSASKVLDLAARLVADLHTAIGVTPSNVSADFEDGRSGIYVTVDNADGRVSAADLDLAAEELDLERQVGGEGWLQYSHEYDTFDVFLDVWTEEPRPTISRSARRYVRGLAGAVGHDRYLDVVLLSAAALGAAAALTARRAFTR